MKIIGSIVEEQGVTFAIVLVKHFVTQSQLASDKEIEGLRAYFADIPIVLASQDSLGRFEYRGRKDIVELLSRIDPARIPWNTWNAA